MKFTDKLQTYFGVSKSELTVSSVILLGLFLGLILKNLSNDKEINNITPEVIYKALDSLAEAHKTTYIGTDINNNPTIELSDVDKTKKYSGYQKKQKISSGKININTASKLELMKLPGVGESTSLKILDYRSNQKFNSPEDIMKVKGIGLKKFKKMEPFIEVK